MVTVRDLLIGVATVALAVAAPFLLLIIFDKGDKKGGK